MLRTHSIKRILSIPMLSTRRHVINKHSNTIAIYVTRNARCFNSTSMDGSAAVSIADSPSNNEKFMLIMGKPGGGKGTISSKILEDFPEIEHISTGDILRQHVRDGTDLGKEAKEYMNKGDLVPDEVMIRLVLEDSLAAIDNGKHLLLDGFPRTIEQAKALDDNIDIEAVVDLNIPTETIVERISDRWIHPASGRVYNYSYNPPLNHGKDDETGENLVQRDDDKPTTVRKRLDAYDKVTIPLLQYYNEKGVLKTFSGTMSDKIYPEVKKWLNNIGLSQ